MTASSVPAAAAQTRHAYVLLDGLRGVAAAAVAIIHMEKVFGGFTPAHAPLAVDFFLQLSGFIVAHAYANRIQSGLRFRAFAWRRIARLYPAFALGMLLAMAAAVATMVLGGTGSSVPWTPVSFVCSAIPNSLMLPQVGCLDDPLLFPLNLPMWTVFYEVVINFIFFALVGSALMLRRLAPAAVVMLALLLALTWDDSLDVGWRWSTALPGFARMAFSFLVGLIIYSLHLRRRGTSTVVALLLPAALAVVLFIPVEGYWLEVSAVVLVFPAIVACGACFEPAGGRLAWVLSQLGLASYVIYVLHKPLYQLGYGALQTVLPGAVESWGAWLGGVMLSGIVAVSWVVARRFEPWARARMEASVKPPLKKSADRVSAVLGRGPS